MGSPVEKQEPEVVGIYSSSVMPRMLLEGPKQVRKVVEGGEAVPGSWKWKRAHNNWNLPGSNPGDGHCRLESSERNLAVCRHSKDENNWSGAGLHAGGKGAYRRSWGAVGLVVRPVLDFDSMNLGMGSESKDGAGAEATARSIREADQFGSWRGLGGIREDERWEADLETSPQDRKAPCVAACASRKSRKRRPKGGRSRIAHRHCCCCCLSRREESLLRAGSFLQQSQSLWVEEEERALRSPHPPHSQDPEGP